MAVKNRKRSRGRPTKMDQLIHSLQENVVSGEELFSGAYDDACRLIVAIMNNEKAPAATRLNAAKTVREAVEKSLEAYENDQDIEDEDDPETSHPKLVI